MRIIDALVRRILAELREHVTDIVEQCGKYHRRGFARGFRLRRRLQRVRKLADVLEPVTRGALRQVKRFEFGCERFRSHSYSPSTVRAMASALVHAKARS